MNFPWLTDYSRADAQTAIELAFDPERLLFPVLQNIPAKRLKRLVLELDDCNDGNPYDNPQGSLERSLNEMSDYSLRLEATRALVELARCPEDFSEYLPALKNLQHIQISEHEWVRHYAKLTCQAHLARSYSNLFDAHPYKIFFPDNPDATLDHHANAMAEVTLEGSDLNVSSKTLSRFTSLVIGQMYPEIEDYGYRLGNFMLGCEQYEMVVEKLRHKDSLGVGNLLSYSPRDFEKLIGELLLEFGFEVELTQKSKDGGIDLLCAIKKEGSSETMIVECKRYSDHVGVQLVRQLVGANAEWNADKMVYVAVSGYTKSAEKFALVPTNTKSLTLISGEEIIEWIKDKSIKKQWRSTM
jgi:hypothetical protein